MLKQVSLKGPYEGITTSGKKLVNLTRTYNSAIFWSTVVVILFCYEGFARTI